MSEEQQTEQVEQQETPIESNEQPQMSAAEQKARSNGWTPKEEWEAAGKDPSDWVNYAHFNKVGDLITRNQNLQHKVSEVDQRIANNNELWKARIEQERTALKAQKKEAVELADADQVEQIDKQLDQLNEQESKLDVAPVNATPQLSEQDAAIENQYFEGLNSPAQKAYAVQLANQIIPTQGLSGQELVDAINLEMRKEFPQRNDRRNGAAPTDSRKPKGSSKGDDDYSLDSLDDSDKAFIQTMKNTAAFKGMSDKEILKTLKDSKL